MSMKYLALIVFVYIIGSFLAATFELHNTPATWPGTATGEDSTLQVLSDAIQGKNLTQEQSLLGGRITIALPNIKIWDAAFKMITWRFDFIWYDDLGRMFYWVVLMPFVVASVVSIFILLYGMITGALSWS